MTLKERIAENNRIWNSNMNILGDINKCPCGYSNNSWEENKVIAFIADLNDEYNLMQDDLKKGVV